MSQFPGGQEFFAKWLELEKKDIGHDQDGLNMLVSGSHVYIQTVRRLMARECTYWASMQTTTGWAAYCVLLVA